MKYNADDHVKEWYCADHFAGGIGGKDQCGRCWDEKTFDQKHPQPWHVKAATHGHENGEGTGFTVYDAAGEKLYFTWDSIIYEFFTEAYPQFWKENLALKESLRKALDAKGLTNEEAIEALKLLKVI
jgi:hypothetical protein